MMKKRERVRSRVERPDPSPKRIRQMSAAIREGWSDRERAKRAGLKESAWTPPQVRHDELRDVNSASENEMAVQD